MILVVFSGILVFSKVERKYLQPTTVIYALIPRLPRDGVKQLSLDGVIKLTESLINPLGNELNVKKSKICYPRN